jgi:signal transduction histidine kinase
MVLVRKMLARVRVWLANLGLQRRIQLLTVVGLLVVFAFFWLTGRRAVEESTQQSLNHQLTVATLIASLLDHRLNTALTLLETTAAQPELSSGKPANLYASLFRDAQLRLSAYGRRIFWLDPDGNVLYTEPFDATLLSKPFPDFSAVRLTLEEGIRRVSNLCRPPDSAQPYILLVVPVFRSTGEIDGLLVEEIGADQLGLAGVLDQVAPGGTAYIEVVDHEGNVLASSLPGHCFGKGDHTNQFTRMIDNRQPMVGECHHCHAGDGEKETGQIDEVLAFAPLSVVPWGVAVRQPASEVMAPVDYLWRQMLLGGGVMLAIALLIMSWFIRRQIVGPIRALDEVSVQLATGNLGAPIPKSGVDEMARLTANLEQMRARLEATLEDHRSWNEALQEMVEERTRELVTLYEQLEGKEAICRQLLGKVLTAQEEERTRLARELHDTIGQSLTAIMMTTAAVENNLPSDFLSGKEKLASVRGIAAQALRDLRNLIFDLRPETLDDLGLALALRSQAKKHLDPAGVQVRLKVNGLKERLPAEVEIAVFRVVQEAITNIARHAQASKADILLAQKNGRLIVRVEDNGVGFDSASVMSEGQKGWGLRGMKERITLLGGEFYVGPGTDDGTLVLAEVPLNEN